MKHAATALLSLGAPLLVAGLLSGPSLAQTAKPDQVYYRNSRGQIRTDTGTISENNLTKTVIETSQGNKSRNSDTVVRVVLGQVPQAFSDGRAYFERGDFENSAAKYKLAATDAAARSVVQAVARLRAAEAFLKQGAQDPGAFAESRAQAETYLADFADGRDVPRALWIKGRVQLLEGDAAGAAATWRGLYSEAAGGSPSTGYTVVACYEAGIDAAHAFLAAGDVAQARELFGSMDSTLPTLISSLEDDAVERVPLRHLRSDAQLGEGWVLLAEGSHSQATTFFRGQLRMADAGDFALLLGARLGLAESLLSSDKIREAQIEFASVSALEYKNRDRSARALLGLARCGVALPESAAKGEARTWLETLLQGYGDTPSASAARDLLQTL